MKVIIAAAVAISLLTCACSPRRETPPAAASASPPDEFADIPPEAQFDDSGTPAFADYPAELYKGAILQPDFNGAQKDYADYRTRIRQAVADGPAFAGSLTIIYFGCGTSCRTGFMYDLHTGVFHELPAAGEDYLELALDYRPDSRLLISQWREGDLDHLSCVRTFHEWTDNRFKEKLRQEAKGQCPDILSSGSSSSD